METMIFDNDITVFYIAATSFPNGVMEAHQKLHALVPFSTDRKFFGISRPEKNIIQYKAAAEETTPGEAAQLNLDTLMLKKGKYICLTITDFMNDIPAIGKAFQELLSQQGLDPQGYCVEWYFNKTDIKCMVRLAE